MIVRTTTELDHVFDELEKAKWYCIDTETMDRGYPDIQLVGMSIGWSSTGGAYIPVGHKEGAQLPKEYVMERMKKFVDAHPEKMVVMHNAKYDMTVLELNGGIKFSELIFDTMVASWLIDTEGAHGLKPLARRYLNYAMVELDEITKKTKDPRSGDTVYLVDEVPIETMGMYAKDDATKPLELMELFVPKLEEDGMLKVFCELEMPKVFILKDIETRGILLDWETLKKRMDEAPAKLEEIEKQMYSLRKNGEPFNANSSQQLNKILFEELKIKPIGEAGKSGQFSTNKEFMEEWAVDHPLVESILEYRQTSKLIGTYLKGLTKRIGEDGRIRTHFNPILMTGRLSSSSPNLQNIPRPDNDKFGLRDMFVAGPGKKLVVADYSQVELRVLAHISRDPLFTKAFKDNEDLHSYAAKMLFDLPEPVGEVKHLHKAERSIGKTFNFAMVYEAGVKTLARGAKVSEKRAKELRSKYMERFHGIESYIEQTHATAEKQGYVSTLVGRRRHLPDAQIKGNGQNDRMLKSSALRQSSNSPVQGSAADILFIAMRNIRRRLIAEGIEDRVWLVLQVHDELIYEVDEDLAEYAAEIVKGEMEKAVQLRVPLIADTEIGTRWSDCK